VVGAVQPINQSTFNSMELYLMGLTAPAEVGTFFVLKNQSQNLTTGQVLDAGSITNVTVDDVIAAHGPRVPDSTQSQRAFRCATIVVSEQLLDLHAMALYDFFARRCEATQPLMFASGFATGTGNPWFQATGGRSVMFSKIPDDIPTPTITRQPDGDTEVAFVGKPGIRYQLERSDDLIGWVDDGPAIAVPITNPPGDGRVNVTPAPLPGARRFYRLRADY
jgi:hypothetical protein